MYSGILHVSYVLAKRKHRCLSSKLNNPSNDDYLPFRDVFRLYQANMTLAHIMIIRSLNFSVHDDPFVSLAHKIHEKLNMIQSLPHM